MCRPLVLSLFESLAVWATSLYLLSCANPRQPNTPARVEPSASTDSERWWYFLEESRIDRAVHDLSGQYRPSKLAIVHATLLSMSNQELKPDQTVVIDGGKFVAVGPTGQTAVPRDAKILEGTGRYLMPGLTDAHVHQEVSSSQHLLHLAMGITTVRDLDGHPWMLAMRDRIRNGRLLAPNVYLSGTILNAVPMEWYATVVRTPEEGRQQVRAQKAAGYDFIKVHNVLPLKTYLAIADEARINGLDLVGHIPQSVTIAQAVAAGQRTFEHLKGYILDRTLTLSTEDYVAATRGALVWNCPTLYTYVAQLRGQEARPRILTGPEMEYVSPRVRQRWLAIAEEPADPVQQGVFPLSLQVMRDLLPIHARFLAGTDSGGGYPLMVPGFALHEEVRLLVRAGLSPIQALEAATIEPARAMGREQEFGSIKVGKRADLLLLTRNPRLSISDLGKAIQSVVVRGILLGPADRERLLRAVHDIYAATWPGKNAQITGELITEIVQTHRQLAADSYVFRAHDLDELADLLAQAHRPEEADEMRRLAVR